MPRSAPTVAILPFHMKLGPRPGNVSLKALIWPLGAPDGIEGRRLRDLRPQDHLLVFSRKSHFWRTGFGTPARVSIAVVEPSVIHGAHLRALRWFHRRFYRVLSQDETLLDAIPNGVFLPFGSTWVPEWRELDVSKSRMTSLIASAKKSQTGHKLRHRLADWASSMGAAKLDVMGGGYKPFGPKSEGLAPYRFSVVIENVRERNYFTEKLIDAILCGTVPIYWGCPNIGDFIDTSAMIICESEADLRAAILSASGAEYAARLPALKAIQPVAAHYGDLYGRAARAVLEG